MASTARTISSTMSATTNGARITVPSNTWNCHSGCCVLEGLEICFRCHVRARCAPASAIKPASPIASTSARICGEVSLSKTPRRALSALSIVYWLKGACGALPSVASGLRPCSGIEIRDQLALQARDLVLEHELALLQALQLQLIDVQIERQARDDLVEITMLDAQLTQFFHVAEQLAVDVVFDFRHGGSARGSPVDGLGSAGGGRGPVA